MGWREGESTPKSLVSSSFIIIEDEWIFRDFPGSGSGSVLQCRGIGLIFGEEIRFMPCREAKTSKQQNETKLVFA